MNIELSNGLDHLFQWDKGQKVKIPGDVPTVHFKWGNVAVPFDVVDGWVEIPPELTQKPGDILLWTYKDDHTLDAAKIPVEHRQKPDGYAYTPTEIKTWEALDARIEALEAANVQPNWNQNDTSAADYVRGRTHYVGAKHDVRIINQNSGPIIPDLGLIVGNSYRVWYDNGNGFGGDTAAKEFICKTLSAGDGAVPNPYAGKPYVGNADTDGGPNPYLIFDNGIVLHPGFDHAANPRRWKIEGEFTVIKTLDSKYLDPTLLERIQALEDGVGVAGVSSVNGETGHVTITAAGIGAATPSEVTSAVNSAWSEAQKTLQPMFDAKQPKGDYITQEGLQDATNAALAQAKASGEFDGAPGAPGAPGTNGTTPHIGDNGNWYLGDTDTGKPSQGPAGAGLDVTGATVGQTVKISAVDDNGVPTAWEPVDMASEETWEKITEIDFDVDAANDVSVWEYKNLPNYKELAYRKVSLAGSTETHSGISISINGSSPAPSGIAYSKKGGQSSGWGKILLLPFGWVHVNSGSASSPTNYSYGNMQAIYTAIQFSGESITSVRLSAHTIYKIAGGKLLLYGRK